MEGRTDFAKYFNGATNIENFVVLPHGPITRRPGTYFVSEIKTSSANTRLIPFTFSTTQTYILELGNNYIRFFKDSGQIVESDVTISGITKANPGVVTANSHGFANGDFVNISSVVGMTEVNGETFKVANKATNTFELTDVDGNNVNTSSFTTYSSGGVATSGATIYGNSSGSGQFCWTVAAGITTYTGETYDSDYATAQGVTPVASGEGTTNARLKCGSSVSGKGFATEIIDHFGEDATFVGFMNYGELDVATDTGISGIELAGNMLQADNTIATNEDHSRRIAQIYRYATPVVITENTNSFKLKVTTYSSVSIDMATDANASHRIYGAKVGGDPFIIQVETGTAD